MRFLVQSDLHLEFEDPYIPPKGGYDAVILAGDTGVGTQGVMWANTMWPETPVVYLLGNHEYYKHSWEDLPGQLKKLANSNVHVLDNDEVVIGGVRILGSTLWSDLVLGGRIRHDVYYAKRMNDYRRILSVKGRYKILTPAQTVARHVESVRWIKDRLAEKAGLPTIVATHHAPSAKGMGFRQEDGLAPAYGSDLDELVAQSGADLWIHGHTHVAKEYECGNVKVLSNSRGYPDENSKGWQNDMIVDIG